MVKLNVEQFKAIQTQTRITYVDAGAGTGKTTTLIERVVKCIELGVKPWNIIVLAFNNKIVEELKKKFTEKVGIKRAEKINIYTIHGYARKVLANNVVIKTELFNEDVFEKFVRNSWSNFKKVNKIKSKNPKNAKDEISLVINMVSKCRENNSGIKNYDERYKSFYDAFKNELKKSGAYDFARIVKVATKYIPQSNTPQYIFVDEFQDTSETRFNFIKALVGNNNYLFAVGDEYQQILEWSGVKNVNVSRLKRHYKHELSIYKLTYSYRLTPQLADISNRLLSFISDRKTTRKLRGCNNSKFTFDTKKFNSQKNETEWCVGYINELVKKGVNPKNIGVLYRNSNVIDQEVINTKAHCSTIHKAKGLEFDYVILLGLEDGVFPGKNSNVEEERRVLYVAITRAKKYLAITSLNDCYRNGIYVKGSSFLKYLI